MKPMKVIFNGTSNAQANWGSGKDPRKYLKEGETYEVAKTEIHSWHTLYYISIESTLLPFNSVCFSLLEPHFWRI